MRISVLFTLLLAAAWAQTPAPKPDPMAAAAAAAKAAAEASTMPANAAQGTTPVKAGASTIPIASVMPIEQMPPDRLVATVDGKPVTAGDLQAFLAILPPQAQQAFLKDRQRLFTQYGMVKRLATAAEEAKLDQRSPWKEQLGGIRLQVLAQARIEQRGNEILIPADEVQKSYDGNKDRFMQAKVKAIYLPFSTAPVSKADDQGKKVLTEDEAKAKAQDLLKQIRGGADFVKLVKENSGDPKSVEKDGDFGTIRKSDTTIPGALRSAIFAAKAGEVAEPVRVPGGYYLLRIEELGPQPFGEVQANIVNEIRDVRFREWLTAEQKSITVKEEGIEMTLGSSPAVSPAPQAKPEAKPKN
jgi:parvulin-like peptidyl-prolyl isomerase